MKVWWYKNGNVSNNNYNIVNKSSNDSNMNDNNNNNVKKSGNSYSNIGWIKKKIRIMIIYGNIGSKNDGNMDNGKR